MVQEESKPLLPESKEPQSIEELIEDSSISTVSNVPPSDNGESLYHRSPSITS